MIRHREKLRTKMMVFRILCPLGTKPRLYRFSLKSSSSNIIERINQGPANGSILGVAEFAPTLHPENLSANPIILTIGCFIYKSVLGNICHP